MAIMVLGGITIAAAVILDSFFKFRMTKLGHKWVFLKGGAFDYKEYHKERLEHGWAAWPVFLMWVLLICGIALLIGGFLVYSWPQPSR
jgi:hypothetical protein